MRFDSNLCHYSESKVIVRVEGWNENKSMGSALGEGTTIEHAEENAIFRLNKRIANKKENNKQSEITNRNDINYKDNINLENSNVDKKEKRGSEYPVDWSNELTEIDLELSRLKWSREDEIIFLDRELGYKNRNQITDYDELLTYLNKLKDIDNNDITITNDEKKKILIKESEIILNKLSWDYSKGREYLKKEFNVLSRNELDTDQLMSFVQKLKSIRKH